jgi:hypothetical protein
MQAYLLLFAVCAYPSIQREETHLPNHHINNQIHSSIKKFIKPGYLILDQADGDLNNDGLIDKILILREKREITLEEQRPVLILIKQNNGRLKLVAENDNLVLSAGDGGIHGDPYHGITIKNNRFSIEHFGGSGWRWNQVITFKFYQEKHSWYWLSTGNQSWHIDSPSQLTPNSQKANAPFISFSQFQNPLREK